jgi:hypothetical protein
LAARSQFHGAEIFRISHPQAIRHNVAVAVGFSIGTTESCTLCESFRDALARCQMDPAKLHSLLILSDEGKGTEK